MGKAFTMAAKTDDYNRVPLKEVDEEKREVREDSTTELGCMIRKTGGDYAYVMETFGGFLAFMRLYVESMIIRPCTVAIVALSFAVYSVKYVFPECEPPDEAVRLLAA